MNRTRRRASGLVLEEIDERTIDWTYDSDALGRVEGQLEYIGGSPEGWTIRGLPTIPPNTVSFWLIPLGLMEAVEKIEEHLERAEREAALPTPEEKRRKAEMDDLFDDYGTFSVTLPSRQP